MRETDHAPRVDVILAAYNGREYIGEQIRSILHQQGAVAHVHVFDDASRDETREIVQQLSAETGRVWLRPYSIPSGGAFQNFCRAISDFAAPEDVQYIAFSDQDDIWDPSKLAKQLRALQSGGAVGCSTSVMLFSAAGQRFVSNNPRQVEYDFMFESAGQGCTYLLDRDFFSLVQRDLEKRGDRVVCHDGFAYALSRALGKTWLILDEPLLWYRQHGANAFGGRGGWKAIKNRLAMIRSGEFKERRTSLTDLLLECHPELRQELWAFSNEASWMARMRFLLPRILRIRRRPVHSLLMFVLAAFRVA